MTTDQLREIINRDEQTTTEFKKSFGWDSPIAKAEYLQTLAAFHNNKGGYLIFGVVDGNRQIKGIADKFKNLDIVNISQALVNHFTGIIDFEKYFIPIDGVNVGVLYVHPLINKSNPSTCLKNSENILKEGALYFRRPGGNSILSYSEYYNTFVQQPLGDADLEFRKKVRRNEIQPELEVSATFMRTNVHFTITVHKNECILKRVKYLDGNQFQMSYPVPDTDLDIHIKAELWATFVGYAFNGSYTEIHFEIIYANIDGDLFSQEYHTAKPLTRPKEYLQKV